MRSLSAAAPVPLEELCTSDLRRKGTLFAAGDHVYSTTGRILGMGGTGTAYMARRFLKDESVSLGEDVVLKILSTDVLWGFEHVPVLRSHFAHNRKVIPLIDGIAHPNLMPHYLAEPIVDNFLVIRPMADTCLNSYLIGRSEIGQQDRLVFFTDALEGLNALHRHGIVHGDFTLRNLAVSFDDDSSSRGFRLNLFDFDQSVAPSILPPDKRSYRAYFDGYLVGCPQFSTIPEFVDDDLGEEPMCARGDVYAAGAVLFYLLTEEIIYGKCDDVEEIQKRIQQGVVRGGESDIAFPRNFPKKLRPVVECCLQRNPRDRYRDAGEIIEAIHEAVKVSATTSAVLPPTRTQSFVKPLRQAREQRNTFAERPDRSLTAGQYKRAVQAVANYGYRVERCLKRVKGNGAFIVQPEPALLAADQFVDRNDFRKVVTVVDLLDKSDADAYVAEWMEYIRPVVERVRQSYMTQLYRVVHDTDTGQLLLFTEYVADVRFGTDLLAHEIPMTTTLALAVELAEPLCALHGEGIAHNNVGIEALMFKGDRESGTVQPLLAGMVEPSLQPELQAEDVCNFAQLIVQVLGKSGPGTLWPTGARAVEAFADELVQIARHEMPAPSIEHIAAGAAEALAGLDRNFAMVRDHHGDQLEFSGLLSHARLFHLLYR